MLTLNNGRRIGDAASRFIIAEIGANHNRSLALAKEMIDAAVEACADAVKFQITARRRSTRVRRPAIRDTARTSST